MATAGVSADALKLLQRYSIDVKDFTKARARYATVLRSKIRPAAPPAPAAPATAAPTDIITQVETPIVVASNSDVMSRLTSATPAVDANSAPSPPASAPLPPASTSEEEDIVLEQEQLRAAWSEYVSSAQTYFSRVMKGFLFDLLREGERTEASSTRSSRRGSVMGSMDLSKAISRSNTSAVGASASAVLHVVSTSEADPSTVVKVLDLLSTPLDTPTPTLDTPAPSPINGAGGGAAAGGNPLMNSPDTALSAHSVGVVEHSPTPPPLQLTLQEKAEKLNDCCALCDKWLVRNEDVLELPSPKSFAGLAATCVASVSKLLRLLGLRLAYVCAGNAPFLRTFLEDAMTARWVGLCGDRELFAEVEGLLNLIERILTLQEADPKGFPSVPFGWMYRVCALLDTEEMMPSIPPKRKSQAIKVAIHYFQVCPAQAASLQLHTLLMRACLVKGGTTLDEAKSIVELVLSIFDKPATRQYIHTSDIGVLFAPFLNTYSHCDRQFLDTLNMAKDVIVMMLSTWEGSLWIGSESTCIRSMIDLLYLPGNIDLKMVIITLFNKLFVQIAPHRGIVLMNRWDGMEEDKRRRAAEAAVQQPDGASASFTNLSVSAAGGIANAPGNESTVVTNILAVLEEDPVTEELIPTTKALGYHVMDPLLARVLLMLAHHGLPLALVALLQSLTRNKVAMDAAGNLLQDLFVLMDTVLPKKTVRGLHETFNTTVGLLAWDGDLYVGGLTSQLYHTYTETKLESAGHDYTMSNATQLSAMYGAAAVTSDMDDETFLQMLKDTKVEMNPLASANWNYDLLLLLVQGPLRNIRRLRQATSTLKLLVAFYTPRDSRKFFFLRCFSMLTPELVTSQMCALGVELMDLLLTSHEGTALLEDSDYPTSIVSMLKEVRAGHPLTLSKARVRCRVGLTILCMMGRFTAYANGLVLFKKFGVFERVDGLFYQLRGERLNAPTEEDTLPDVCDLILRYMHLGAVPNFGVSEDIRNSFRVALEHPSGAIRLCAAMQLRKYIWRDLSTSMRWDIETLVLALKDDMFSVVQCAYKLLLSVCLCSNEGLDYLISLNPKVLMENELLHAHSQDLHLSVLLYRIAGRPLGFKFLYSYGWIEEELHRWEATESAAYVRLIRRLQGGEMGVALIEADINSNNIARRNGSMGAGRRTHSRSYSDSVTGSYYKGVSGAGGGSAGAAAVPILTTTAIANANFFPIHFAAVMCKSKEGCEVFKHSALWTRSVQCLMSQPVMPTAAYTAVLNDADDSDGNSSNGEDTSEDDSGCEDLMVESQHAVRTGYATAVTCSFVSSTTHNGQNLLPNSVANGGVMGSVGMGSMLQPGMPARGGADTGDTAAAGGAGMDRVQASTLSAGTAAGATGVTGGGGIAWKKNGQMPSTTIISAARGYRPVRQSFLLECVGDIATLKDAIMCVCQVASSDVGYDLAKSVPGLLLRLFAIMNFASTISVRCLALIGSVFICRARGATELEALGFTVLNNLNAYVSAAGIPYAVSFAHRHVQRSLCLSRRIDRTNTIAKHAYADYGPPDVRGLSQRLIDHITGLCTPVTREKSKTMLYKLLKKYPLLFLEPRVQQACLDATSIFRMRHVERKFLADLLEKAQVGG